MGVFDPGLQAVTCRSIILGQLESGLIGITIRSLGGGGETYKIFYLLKVKKKPIYFLFWRKEEP